MSTQRGKLIPFWRNVATHTVEAEAFVEDDDDKPKTMNHLLAEWELIRRHRIDLEGELIKVTAHEKRCVDAINEELKRLGVPRT